VVPTTFNLVDSSDTYRKHENQSKNGLASRGRTTRERRDYCERGQGNTNQVSERGAERNTMPMKANAARKRGVEYRTEKDE
jgi:hypothetical protein